MQKLVDILELHGREKLHKFLHRETIVQIVEEGLHGHTGASEDKRPSKDLGAGANRRVVDDGHTDNLHQ